MIYEKNHWECPFGCKFLLNFTGDGRINKGGKNDWREWERGADILKNMPTFHHSNKVDFIRENRINEGKRGAEEEWRGKEGSVWAHSNVVRLKAITK